MEVTVETAPIRELDDDWLEQLLVAHYRDLLRLAFLILHNSTEAEDATQLALERAWRSRAQLRTAESALSWLRRIVVRESLRARSSPWSGLRLPHHLVEQRPVSHPIVPQAAERLDILKAFEHLPADQSAVVVLHHYYSYSITETAGILGIPLETARSRLRVAIRKLREELRDA